MRLRGFRNGMVGRGRTLRALLALGLATVLAGGQGIDHSHASTPDALQCAVCHWGTVQAPAPAPAAVLSAGPPAALAAPATLGVAAARPADHSPPVRGPPSLV